ncbi:prepilin-type N-terminal cleavage/methylation domain-containing protein [Luteimonas sp. SJ-92]|uniref:Prepilin-type N-terminal cleavage/methylation domain-containing protein n=1 Tax=Luteimonas salinisoli TaxID=2752307 RepID=A0A853J8V1_9GAMM|nr:prepilin-type N-terminal cleavage/methylation domain-containing protein [Luteimonas salinisoli]NZA25164.1 prepilin-type N-terminal cleavage/methylation domain-containing protein [Luteimonas salinisoli]
MKSGIRRGFSLIELMVVMAIIGALVAIALPRYQASVENARVTALKANLHVLRESLDRHYDDKGRYPESLQELVEARYLKAIPVDPITESAQTWVAVGDSDGTLEGVVDVYSGAEGTTPDGVDYSGL